MSVCFTTYASLALESIFRLSFLAEMVDGRGGFMALKQVCFFQLYLLVASPIAALFSLISLDEIGIMKVEERCLCEKNGWFAKVCGFRLEE